MVIIMIYFIKQFLITAAIAIPIYLIVRRPWRFKNRREWALGIFIIYIVCLLSLTLKGTYDTPSIMIQRAIEKIQTPNGIHLKPFEMIIGFTRWNNPEVFFINVTCNILIFIPFGFGLPLLWKKNQKILRLLFLCLALTVFIEFFQMFIERSTDIDDVILNFAGGCIGAGLYFILAKVYPKIKNIAK